MAFINGMLSENLYKDYLYVVSYYAILCIPIFILDDPSPAKNSAEIKPNVSSENILPAGAKRASRAPRKFSTSQYDAPKPAAKQEGFVPEAVVKKDVMNDVTVYEIKWQGLSESQNTWASEEQFSQAPLSEHRHLIAHFEAANANASAKLHKPRQSMAKEDKALWPPPEEPVKVVARRASKATGTKIKVVVDDKENSAPVKPAPAAPSTKTKRSSRSSSVVRKTATRVKVTEKKKAGSKALVDVALSKGEKAAEDLSPRRTRRSVAHKI